MLNIMKIFLLFMVICNDWPFLISATKDTLEQGQVLNSTSYLISKNGLFTLGFYALDSNRTYLAIWYSDNRGQPVWLANRDKPIPIGSGVLTIDLEGRLGVTHPGGSPIILYSSPSPASNLTSTLLNTGNFVLSQKNPDGSMSNVLWQSFDHPTDTLLPGMKLGNNLKTGERWILTSWMSANDTANGSFTFEWDANEQRLVVKERGGMFWTSNELKDNRFANFLSFDDVYWNYNFTSVKNMDEEYLMYSLFVDQWTPQNRRNGSKWFLTYDGDIVDGDRPNIISSFNCKGGNDDHGCKVWEGPKCRKDGDIFELRSGRFRNPKSGDNQSVGLIDNVTLEDCKIKCWKDCECSGVMAYTDPNGTTCNVFSGIFEQGETVSSVQYFVIFPGPTRDKKWIWILTASLVALFFLTILCIYCYRYLRARKLKKQEKILLELLTMEDHDPKEIDQNDNTRHNLEIFSVATILTATQNFSLENKLGEGGFGPVFKGKLPEGQDAAIKKLSRTSRQGLSEFKSELVLVAKLQHTNLVRLLGFSMFKEEKVLVYEFMPNKSLDCFIFDVSKRELLDWTKRFNIIEGIAQGVLYLHKYSRLKIVHRDLKTSNILLDENMNPKISDFGLAKIFRRNESEANTLRPVGTYGYMPPEYAMDGVYSEKSDVYSFGVITLEVISGRKNNSFYTADRLLNLVGHAWELWKNDVALDLIDPSLLNDKGFEHQILRCINIGLLCVEESASHRPTMSEVVSMLTSEGTQLPSPKYPAFLIGRRTIEGSRCEDRVDRLTVNGLTISDMVPR